MPKKALSTEERMKSEDAIEECISALGQARTLNLEAKAVLKPGNPTCARGSVSITFHRPSRSDLAMLICSDLRSFKISHVTFDPKFDDVFTFKKEGMELSVVSGENCFVLTEIQLRI